VADLDAVGKAVGKIDESPTDSGLDLNSRMDALKERAAAAQDGFRELGNEVQRTDSKIRLGGAAAAGAAIGSAVLGKTIGELSKALSSIDLTALRQIAPEMAAQVEQAKGWAEVLTDPINGLQRVLMGTTISDEVARTNEAIAGTIQMQQDHIQRLIDKGAENTQELERLMGRLDFLNKLSGETRKADVAAGKRADANAGPDTPAKIAAGTDSKSREAARIVEEAAVQARALADALTPLKERLESAAGAARAAQANVGKVEADPSATANDVVAARKNAAELSNKTGELSVELDRQNQLLGQQLRTVTEEGGGKIEDLARQTGEAVTQAAQAAIADIKKSGKADNPGAGTEAVAALEKLVSDDVPDEKQGGSLQGILQRLANSLTAKDAVLSTGLEALIKVGEVQKKQYDGLKTRIDELSGKVNQKN
jgi:hypothetical protein